MSPSSKPQFSGERIVPEADNCEPNFARKMYQEHVARYLLAAQLCSGKTVIDIGCGIGYGSQILAREGAKSVYAFDISKEAIDHAREYYDHDAVTFDVESAHDFTVPEPVDLIVCFELIEHVEHQELVLRRMSRFLKPDGVLIISTPRALEEKRTHFHTHEFGLGEFEDLLLQNFARIEMWFENNHFSTLIASAAPKAISSVHNINNEFTLKTADYFVAIAFKDAALTIPKLEDVFVISDESYVKLLERDVDILHRAEDDLKARYTALEGQFSDLRQVEADVRSEANRFGQQLTDTRADFERLEHQLSDARAEIGRLGLQQSEAAAEAEVTSQTLAFANAEVERLRQDLSAAATQAEKLSEEVCEEQAKADLLASQFNNERTAFERRLQETEADLVQRLMEAGDRARSLSQDHQLKLQITQDRLSQINETLRCERQKANELEQEVLGLQQLRAENASLRNNFSEVAATAERLKALLDEMARREAMRRDHSMQLLEVIDQYRASTSWKLTAPIRALKLGPLKLMRRIPALARFFSQNGWPATRALIRRKLGLGTAEGLHGLFAPSHGTSYGEFPLTIWPDPTINLVATQGVRPTPQIFDVVFFIGCWEGESKRYRVYNVAEALTSEGFRVKIHPESACYDLVTEDWRARCVVFFRAPYQERFRTEDVMERTRANGGRVVFDVDDLVFEPGLIDQIHGFQHLSPQQQDEYRDGVERYRKLLLACDFATVSTSPLARAVEAVGKPVRIIPNSINRAQIEAADRILQDRTRRSSERIRIGYFSGSRTHERDFAQVAPSLLALLKRRPDVEFLLVGLLDLEPEWDAVSERIVRRPFVPPLEMLGLLGTCDINLAPLEVGDAFCEAKSELKYFEAALVETPTIASATEPFAAAIRDGDTGILASSPANWGRALEALVEDQQLRTEMGARARISALERFGPEATARAAREALLGQAAALELPSTAQTTTPPRRLKIDWVIPRLIIGGGGHRNILRAAHHLQSYGHDVVLHFTSSDDQASNLKDLVRKHFYPFEGEVKAYDGKFRKSDVIFATHWTTVDAALRAKEQTREIMYFVQDFEPAFAPMGSEYVLAENTYRQGLYCITSGPWCERLLKKDYASEADHFRFPVDREVYFPRPRTRSNPNIVFFAKPDMPRRCFEIGAMALAHFHRRRPDVEIILFGSGAINRNTLDFPATLLEIVPTIEDLSAMYSNADLGIVFSTTNPSLVPYEMMASGCPVLDLDRPGNECNYEDRRDIAFLADPIPEMMASQLADLMQRPQELEARRAAGLDFARTFPTEEQMARRVEQLILERLMVRGQL